MKLKIATFLFVGLFSQNAFGFNPHLSYKDEQILCLARNLYFEARNQSKEGMIAVANVTFNRVKAKKFPNDVCGVVYHKINKGCQFSWVCDFKLKYAKDRKTWTEVYNLAYDLYRTRNKLKDNTDGATFYHAKYVKPYWSKIFIKTKTIGDHVFYKDFKRKYRKTGK